MLVTLLNTVKYGKPEYYFTLKQMEPIAALLLQLVHASASPSTRPQEVAQPVKDTIDETDVTSS